MARDSPVDFLRLEAGVEPLEERITKNSQILFEKFIRLKEEDPRRLLAEKEVNQRLKTRYGWGHKTAPIVKKNLNRKTPTAVTKPMMTMKAKMDRVELTKTKDQYTLEELAR